MVAANLNAMLTLQSAKEEFIKTESGHKIRRALLLHVGEDDVKGLTIGDNVYFKRQDDMWHGSGKVIR